MEIFYSLPASLTDFHGVSHVRMNESARHHERGGVAYDRDWLAIILLLHAVESAGARGAYTAARGWRFTPVEWNALKSPWGTHHPRLINGAFYYL